MMVILLASAVFASSVEIILCYRAFARRCAWLSLSSNEKVSDGSTSGGSVSRSLLGNYSGCVITMKRAISILGIKSTSQQIALDPPPGQ
jgi:hypothetical protein